MRQDLSSTWSYCLKLPGHSYHWGKSSVRNRQQEEQGLRCLLPCSRAQVQLLFLYLTGSPAQCCKSSTGLSHPAPINNTRKTGHTDLSAGRFDGGIFSAEALASNVTLVCVKTNEHTLGQVTMLLLDRLTQNPGPGMAQLFGHLGTSSRAPDMTGDYRGCCLPSRT